MCGDEQRKRIRLHSHAGGLHRHWDLHPDAGLERLHHHESQSARPSKYVLRGESSLGRENHAGYRQYHGSKRFRYPSGSRQFFERQWWFHSMLRIAERLCESMERQFQGVRRRRGDLGLLGWRELSNGRPFREHGAHHGYLRHAREQCGRAAQHHALDVSGIERNDGQRGLGAELGGELRHPGKHLFGWINDMDQHWQGGWSRTGF